MARIHTDLHFIPADNIDRALKFLIDNGLITRSEKDVRYCDIKSTKMQYPSTGSFLEVQTIY